MNDWERLNILDVIEEVGEASCQRLLDSYVCPINPEVEHFLKTQALEFAKQRITITYLVVCRRGNRLHLLGYFALANKFVQIDKDSLSKTVVRKISKFARYDPDLHCYQLAMPLIAQLGRNFAPDLPERVKGGQLLDLACDRVLEAERILGGKTVYLEYNDEPKLTEFYTQSAFRIFGSRMSSAGDGQQLTQAFRYF